MSCKLGASFAIWMLFLVTVADAKPSEEVTVIGKLTIQNSGNTPVAGAQVQVGEFGTATVSDANGVFIVNVVVKHPGEKIKLTITRHGWEVVNRDKLTHTLWKEYNDTLRYYLCPEGEWEENAMTYFDFNREKIFASHNARIAALKRENKDTQESIRQAERDRDLALATAKQLADKFAMANLDMASGIYREAFNQFVVGDIEAALNTINMDSLDAQMARASKEITEGREMVTIGKEKILNAKLAILTLAEDYFTRAQLCVARFEFENAYVAYRRAVDAAPDNYDYLHEYGIFLFRHDEMAEAKGIWEMALPIAETPLSLAFAQYYLGEIHFLQNNYEEADTMLRAACQNFLLEAINHPDTCTPELAMSFRSLGIFCHNVGKYDLARNALIMTLKIYDKLNRGTGKGYWDAVGVTYAEIGALFLTTKEYNFAAEAFREAIRIYKGLAEESPERFRPRIAHLYMDLGRYYGLTLNLDSAKYCNEVAFDILEEFVRQDSMAFSSIRISLLNNMQAMEEKDQDWRKAESFGLEAVRLCKHLILENPMKYQLNLAKLYINQAQMEVARQKHEPRGKYIGQAVSKLDSAQKYLAPYDLQNPIVKRQFRRWKQWSTYFTSLEPENVDNIFHAEENLRKADSIKGAGFSDRSLPYYRKTVEIFDSIPIERMEEGTLLDFYFSSRSGFLIDTKPENQIFFLEKASQAARQLMRINPERSSYADFTFDSYQQWTWFLLLREDYKLARQILDKALIWEPFHAGLQSNLALVEALQDNLPAAKEICNDMLDSRNPQNQFAKDILERIDALRDNGFDQSNLKKLEKHIHNLCNVTTQ